MRGTVILVIFCVLAATAFGRKGYGLGEQEWGYVTVRQGTHMFWWLHHTTADVRRYTGRPLVVWLQGGPGASGTGYGNFLLIGPLDPDLKPRNSTWLKDVNVLFVDYPVGTGFSYTDSDEELAKDYETVSSDLVQMLIGVYKKLPELEAVPVYIVGESYGGKAAVDFVAGLYKAIENKAIKANLKGVGLGDAFVSPVDSVLTWAPYLLHVGGIDQEGYEKIQKVAEEAKEAVEAGAYSRATDKHFEALIIIDNLTDSIDFYNILVKAPLKPAGDENERRATNLMNTEVKAALGLTTRFRMRSVRVGLALHQEIMRDATDSVEFLLNSTNVKVTLYNGQLDLIVDTLGNMRWADRLKFPGATAWKKAERRSFSTDGKYVDGYVKESGNLAFYWINRAGHMVPKDNPAAMRYILRELTDMSWETPETSNVISPQETSYATHGASLPCLILLPVCLLLKNFR